MSHAWAAWAWAFERPRRQRVQTAGKAAVAAGLAWQVGVLVPGPAGEYPYYAPLGAVLAMYPTVVSSVRAAAQTLGSIGLGVAVAFAAGALAPANAVTVAVVVGLGILLGGLRVLGEQRSWVPIAALFVLIIGRTESSDYAIALVVQTLIGAVIGAALNWMVFPPLHLRTSQLSLAALQRAVIEQLDDVAEALQHNEPPDQTEWRRRVHSVSPMVRTMREAIDDVNQARRANPRARRHRIDTERQYHQAQVFGRVALLVEDLTGLFVEAEQDDLPALPLRPDVRVRSASALTLLSHLLRSVAANDIDRAQLQRVRDAIEEVSTALHRDGSAGSDMFLAGSVVTCLRRCLGAVETDESQVAIAPIREDLLG